MHLNFFQTGSGELGPHGVPVLKPAVVAPKIGPESVTALHQALEEQLAQARHLKNKVVQPRPAPLVSSFVKTPEMRTM